MPRGKAATERHRKNRNHKVDRVRLSHVSDKVMQSFGKTWDVEQAGRPLKVPLAAVLALPDVTGPGRVK